ncbi:microcystin-dependent protein [Lewinella marina]|uniref:Phage tail protein n=1 Tax=Neolewinella marina TaxID=438751 RepID=A0A2G0CBC4_9BACT|nr:tail fiber protein [Neolewinella marina]NJB87755.1 microcystin-dependent protein [Neolewinella marina]PHK97227.1 phage tail protein [Neolewinella marina]
MEPFLGQVQVFGFNFPPRGWALCEGQILPISQNQSLYSLLGTQFGGNGTTTFALPDLRGRLAVHNGQGPGLASIQIGGRGGRSDVLLTVNNLPAHNHQGTLRMGAGPGLEGAGENKHLAVNSAGETIYTSVPPGAGQSGAGTLSIANTGANVPFDIRNPLLGIGFSIAVIGLFPSRN